MPLIPSGWYLDLYDAIDRLRLVRGVNVHLVEKSATWTVEKNAAAWLEDNVLSGNTRIPIEITFYATSTCKILRSILISIRYKILLVFCKLNTYF